MMKACKPLLAVAVLAVLALAAPVVPATVIVAPLGQEDTDGNSNNCIPFGCAGIFRYQELHDASQFAALGGPALLHELAFRPDRNATAETLSAAFANVVIKPSTTPVAVLGTSFAANTGADVLTVYSGALSLTSANPPNEPAPAPKPFGVIISLQTPFPYDPALGNLLLEFQNLSGETSTGFFLDAHNRPPLRTRLFAANADAATGSRDGLSLVTRFSFIPVPEPATAVLLAPGLAVMGRLPGNARRRIRVSAP